MVRTISTPKSRKALLRSAGRGGRRLSSQAMSRTNQWRDQISWISFCSQAELPASK
jgi:hypothetical protein